MLTVVLTLYIFQGLLFLYIAVYPQEEKVCLQVCGLTVLNAAKSTSLMIAKSAKGYLLQQKIKTSGWEQDSSLVIAVFLPSVVLSWEDYVTRRKTQIPVS